MRALRFSTLLLVLVACLTVVQVAATALAADSPAPAKGKAKLHYRPWVTLFDGKSLSGWKVIGCEAEVADGEILLKAGNGVVRTEKKYGDSYRPLPSRAKRPFSRPVTTGGSW